MAERSAPEACAGVQLRELTGDLFCCSPTASLAHCVSRDMHMGKGIAVLFKKEFGRVDDLKAQSKEVGECAVLQYESRCIFYLVTKDKFFHKPKLTALKQCVVAMRKECVSNGVKELCLPKIGCGLDKLKWPDVREVLLDAFKDTGVQLSIYSL